MKRIRRLFDALYRVYEHSGFAMAGAVAFSFVVSLFPFCIFLGAISGIFGGRELAQDAITQLFAILPGPVAKGLAPEVEAVMGSSRIDLLTVSGFLALFFATSAIETLRAALNGAYRVRETRPYPLCLLISMLFVFVSAISSLVLTWAVVFGPSVFGTAIASQFQTGWIKTLFEFDGAGPGVRYGLAAAVIAIQLFAFHLWLAAGRRRVADVWPGISLSIILWLTLAGLWSHYLEITNYSLFYAGLSQLMIALIFFQFTAITILLGAEFNRGIMEMKRMRREDAERARLRLRLAELTERPQKRTSSCEPVLIFEATGYRGCVNDGADRPRSRPRASSDRSSEPRPAPPCSPACARSDTCACAPSGSAPRQTLPTCTDRRDVR